MRRNSEISTISVRGHETMQDCPVSGLSAPILLHSSPRISLCRANGMRHAKCIHEFKPASVGLSSVRHITTSVGTTVPAQSRIHPSTESLPATPIVTAYRVSNRALPPNNPSRSTHVLQVVIEHDERYCIPPFCHRRLAVTFYLIPRQHKSATCGP